jgi:hypothetical protein
MTVPDGQVSIEVRAHSTYAAAGPQPYALVVSGDFDGVLSPPAGDGSTDGGGECSIVVAVVTSGPPGISSAGSATFEFATESGSSSGVVFECQLAGPTGVVGGAGTQDWTPCTSPLTYDSLPDGSYTFQVRAQGEDITSSWAFIKVRGAGAVVWCDVT